MVPEGTESSQAAAGDGGESGAVGCGGKGEPSALGMCHSLHAHSFKLRFASQREQGRSYVSLVKPLGLPATVTGKFYVREPASSVDEEGTRCALRRIEDMFKRGPRDKYDAPLTSSQVIGWWVGAPTSRADRRLHHHLRDSAWLKTRLCVLAEDDKLKQL